MSERAARFLTGCAPTGFLQLPTLLPGLEQLSSVAERLAAALVRLASSEAVPETEPGGRGRNSLALSSPPVILNSRNVGLRTASRSGRLR